MDSNPDRQALNAQMEAQMARLRGMLAETIDHIDARDMPQTPLEDFRHLRSLEVAGRLTVFLHTPAEELRPRRVSARCAEDLLDEESDDDESEEEANRSLDEWRELLRQKVMKYACDRRSGGIHGDYIPSNREAAPGAPCAETAQNTNPETSPANDDPACTDDDALHSPTRPDARPGIAPSPHSDDPAQPAGLREPDSGPRIRSLAPEWPPP